jgi:hypothetical protein
MQVLSFKHLLFLVVMQVETLNNIVTALTMIIDINQSHGKILVGTAGLLTFYGNTFLPGV